MTEKMDIDSKSNKEASTPSKEEEKVKKEVITPFQELQRNILFLEKNVLDNNLEKLSRVLRNNSKIKQLISTDDIKKAIELYLPNTIPTKTTMLQFLAKTPASDNAMEIDTETQSADKTVQKVSELPEVEIYLYLLIVDQLLRKHQKYDTGLECVNVVLERAKSFNKRTLDIFLAKVYYYYSLCHQHFGTLPSIRTTLLSAHRTACLRHDEIGQATLLNLLLNNYLSQNLYDQAFKLISKTTFPEGVSNNQFVRYLYYVGKIHAVQLDYTDAHTKLMQAIRKTPQNTAHGFREKNHKLSVIVQLLMGEIPERATFLQPDFSQALLPYYELTNAVRIGNLMEFNAVMKTHVEVFKKDKTYNLILRLRHNVIKTGLRKISVSYSRISFKDICDKLALETPENAEFICAKAIYDGVIEAVIDHQNGWMQSKEMVDVYGTSEPQQAFQKRITFCLDVHNEAVKAMRYPPNAYKKELESAEERLEREKQDEELQQEIEKDLDDDL